MRKNTTISTQSNKFESKVNQEDIGDLTSFNGGPKYTQIDEDDDDSVINLPHTEHLKFDKVKFEKALVFLIN